MAIGRFFKSIINTETLGEETITAQENLYRAIAKQFPNEDPHTVLARVWLSRMTAARQLSEIDPDYRGALAMSETQQFACVPAPGNARALGLYFVFKENPDIPQRYPKFAREFEELMKPVFEAISTGGIQQLYEKYNPNVEWEFVSPA